MICSSDVPHRLEPAKGRVVWQTGLSSTSALDWRFGARCFGILEVPISNKGTLSESKAPTQITKPNHYPLVDEHSWLGYPHFNRKHIFKGSIFHCYVSLPECSWIKQNTKKRKMARVASELLGSWAPSGCKWLGSPSFICRKKAIWKGNNPRNWGLTNHGY